MDRILNLATYYVLPLVELSKNSFGDSEVILKMNSNFVNCYVTEEDMIAVQVVDLKLLSTSIFASPYYFTDFPVEDHTILLFRVTGKYLSDIQLFREGLYSKMSEEAKNRIAIFTSLPANSTVMKVLRRDSGLREELEASLGVILPEEAEVKSKPRDTNFINLSTLQNHVR